MSKRLATIEIVIDDEGSIISSDLDWDEDVPTLNDISTVRVSAHRAVDQLMEGK